MTTFLEWVAFKLMGPPLYTKGDGESYWECPRCGSRKWHTRPHREGMRDRYSCWSCQAWGDINDLAQEFASHTTIRLDMWQAEYDVYGEDTRLIPDSPGEKIDRGDRTHRSRHTPVISSPGPTGISREDDPRRIEMAYADLSREEKNLLAIACQLARSKGVDPGALAYYCWHGREWIAASNAAHLAECTDPECDAIVCRAARGLPPPTPEEIAEWRRRHDEEVRAERERLAEIKARARANIQRGREAARNGRAHRTPR